MSVVAETFFCSGRRRKKVFMYVRTYVYQRRRNSSGGKNVSFLSFPLRQEHAIFFPFPSYREKNPLPRKTKGKEGRSEKNPGFADFCGNFRHFAAVLAVDSSNVGISLSSFGSMRRTGLLLLLHFCEFLRFCGSFRGGGGGGGGGGGKRKRERERNKGREISQSPPFLPLSHRRKIYCLGASL